MSVVMRLYGDCEVLIPRDKWGLLEVEEVRLTLVAPHDSGAFVESDVVVSCMSSIWLLFRE